MSVEEELALALTASSVVFLGEGTFGNTYRVDGLDGEDQSVAVKVLKSEHFDERLLERETRNLTDFDHLNIVRFHSMRKISLQNSDHYSIICEYIPGGSAGSSARAHGLPNSVQVRKFALGLFEAVAEMHSKDKIHRDLKPENIMLRNGDWSRPVLIDFGLARSLTGNTMTTYPSLVGSVPWMAPEQLQGQRARKGCDIWACGVILYQLLTGNHPFLQATNLRGMDLTELIELVSSPPAPLPTYVPEDLARLVGRLLIPEPPNKRGSASRALRELKGEN